jgi:hypothetical protein
MTSDGTKLRVWRRSANPRPASLVIPMMHFVCLSIQLMLTSHQEYTGPSPLISPHHTVAHSHPR